MSIVIREERFEDYCDTEYMTQKAFWNLHSPGCNEHLLVHKFRTNAAYIPELSRVTEKDEDLPDKEVDEFNKSFPYMEKLRLPGQWGYKEDMN